MRSAACSASSNVLCLVATILLSASGGLVALAETSPDEGSLSAWAERLIAARPGVPPAATRSQVLETAPRDPAASTRALMNKHVAAQEMVAKAMAAPQLLTQERENAVYTIAFTAANGSRHQFASHLRPDDHRPLFHHGSGYGAAPAAGFAQASAALVERVLGGRTEGLRASGVTNLVDPAALRLSDGRDPIFAPWPRAWVFFVNDEPTAEWEHPCRYVFLAPDLSSYAVQHGRRPMEVRTAGGGSQRIVCVVPHPAVDSRQAAVALAAPPLAPVVDYTGSAQNCHALILSGGVSAFNNWGRYWRNCSQIYSTLVQKYHYSKDHIT